MEYAESIFITRNNIKLLNELGETNLEEKDFSKHNLSKYSCFLLDHWLKIIDLKSHPSLTSILSL